MTLQKFDDIKTESFGEGRDRHVRIIPESEADLGLMNSTLPETEEVEEGEE
jgi:hypothetical protein